MSTCLAELSSDVRRCGESHARVSRCIDVFVRAWSWHNQLIIDCNVFRRWDKINSNVTNDIEVISSLSSDLSSVCLPNCFIFLQTGRAFWFWPMLAGAPKLLWPLLMKAQSTNAHRRCCVEMKKKSKVYWFTSQKKSMNSLSNSPRHLRHLGRMDHRRRLMLMSQKSISSIEGHRLEIEQTKN